MFKRLVLITTSSLLKITVLLLALAGAGWLTFGTPDNLKKAADESNLYQGAVDQIINTAKQEAQNQAEADLPLDDPALEQVARNAFPPELLSTNSESIIDGVYAWLQGKSEAPQFSVDLTDAKQKLSTGIADYAKQRYESLPVCTLEQLRAVDPNNIDAFKAECRVPGLSSDTVHERVLAEIQNSDGFLKDTTFTADDLPKDDQGRGLTDNLAAAPDAYRLFQSLPWILGILSVLFGAGVLFLSDTKRRGLKSLAITLLGTGIFLGIGSWLIGWSFKQINSQQAEAFQTSLIKALESLVSTYNRNLLGYTLAYILAGVGILLTLWYQSRRHKATPIGETPTPESTAVDNTTATEKQNTDNKE